MDVTISAFRRTGDVSVGDLLNKQVQRVVGRKRGVAKLKIAGTGELIDLGRQEKIIPAGTVAYIYMCRRCPERFEWSKDLGG